MTSAPARSRATMAASPEAPQLGVGAGANALVGGSEESIVLQPLSVEGIEGINIAGGIGVLQLKAR